jgi:surface protein
MGSMFMGAKSFNGDLSNWELSNVENIYAMFEGATKFDKKNAPW